MVACRACMPKKAVFIAAQACRANHVWRRLGTQAGSRRLFSYHDV